MQNTLWFVAGGNLCERDPKSHKFSQNIKILMLYRYMLCLGVFLRNRLVDGGE